MIKWLPPYTKYVALEGCVTGILLVIPGVFGYFMVSVFLYILCVVVAIIQIISIYTKK